MAKTKAGDPAKEVEYKPSEATLAGHDATGTVGLPKPGTKLGSEPVAPGGYHGEPDDDSDEDEDQDEG